MRRTISVIILALILVILNGCDNPLSPVLDQISESTDYSPLNIGSQWVYDAHNSNSTSVITLTVDRMEVVEGKNAFIVVKEEGLITTETAYVKETDGIYRYEENTSTRKSPVLNSGWYKTLPYPLLKGNSWILTVDNEKSDPSAYDVFETMIWTITEKSDMTVGAGTFENCYKVEYSYTAEYTNENPLLPDFDIEYYENSWYAPDVGIIKHKQWGTLVPDPKYWELKSYN